MTFKLPLETIAIGLFYEKIICTFYIIHMMRDFRALFHYVELNGLKVSFALDVYCLQSL